MPRTKHHISRHMTFDNRGRLMFVRSCSCYWICRKYSRKIAESMVDAHLGTEEE